MMKKHLIPMAALSILGLTSVGHAARNNNQSADCGPTPPLPCNQENDCNFCYCLGPDNYGVNPPVCPTTCNGDWKFQIAGFYWNAHQDGMEFAIENNVADPNLGNLALTEGNGALFLVHELNNLVNAEYKTPKFKWEPGLRLGIGYCFAHDGWDLNLIWTYYQGRTNTHIEADDDCSVLIALWSDYSPTIGGPLYATDITDHWKLHLELVDLELGRQFWVSKYLSIRPNIGIRFTNIDQHMELEHKGGAWSEHGAFTGIIMIPAQPALNNTVEIKNQFRGAGLIAGLDSYWHLGCGWALYGDLATSIIYGRFDMKHTESNREAATDAHSKERVLELDDHFHASRVILDLALGVQWSTMFCDCKYGFTAMFGWEHHIFFDQNQMWRVQRLDDENSSGGATPPANNSGENAFHQRRGDLDTQGWTLTLKFDF